MAKKVNFLRQAQLIRAGQQIANRQPHPPASALYLMQLRQHPLRISVARPRLEIAVKNLSTEMEPQVVKIIHSLAKI